MKMTWSDLSDLLRKQMDLLCPEGKPSLHGFSLEQEQFLDAFCQVDAQTDQEVRLAVHGFATMLRWPELSPEAKVMLYFRMDYALDLTLALAKSTLPDRTRVVPRKPSLQSLDSILWWLLIHLWEDKGYERTNDMITALRRHDVADTPSSIQWDQSQASGAM
jgi:hypothetical protein